MPDPATDPAVPLPESADGPGARTGADDPLLRLVHGARIGITLANGQGEIVDANRAFLDLVGYERDELRALGWRAITAPEYASRDRLAQQQLDERGAAAPYEKEYLRRDGSRVAVMVSGARLDAAVDEHVTFVVDVSARMHAEAALARTNALLRAVSENTADLIYAKDREGRLLFVNPAFERVMGRRSGELLGLTDGDLLSDAAEARAIRENDRRVMTARQPQVIEEQARARDAAHVYLSTKAPFFDADGEVAGVVGISLDITERKRMEEALRESDRRKDRFLALLAHELRNPLAPLRTGIEVLERLQSNDATVVHTLDSMRRQVSHLSRLVDDLLDAARINEGRIALKTEVVRLSDVVAWGVEIARSAIEARGHRLEVELPSMPIVLRADATRITQILDNLLTNAAKYTPPGGAIRLRAHASGDSAHVVVRDDGVGMTAETLAHLFEPFERAPHTAGQIGGLGIGLWLANKLATLHGGSIRAHSDGLGKGSTLTLSLPLSDTLGGVPKPPRAAPAAAPAEAVRVLIVDDNPDAANTMADLLDLLGYRCATASDGPACLAAAQAAPPDAILLDIGLPGMDGYEVAAKLRAEPATRSALIVALTGYGRPEDRLKSRSAGFDAHLVKPVDPDALLALIAERLSGS